MTKSIVERFVHTLEFEDVDKVKMSKVISTYLVLHMDHGGGNLSTFTGKAIARARATVYSAIAGAMNALSGPLHGRANQSCLEFVLRIGTSDEQEVESFVRGELAAGRPVFGFGHAVLSVEDQEQQRNLNLASRYVQKMKISKSSKPYEKLLLWFCRKTKKLEIQMRMSI